MFSFCLDINNVFKKNIVVSVNYILLGYKQLMQRRSTMLGESHSRYEKRKLLRYGYKEISQMPWKQHRSKLFIYFKLLCLQQC